MAAPIEQEDYVSSPTDKTDVQSSAEDEFLNEVNATFPLILLQCSDCSRVCHNTVVTHCGHKYCASCLLSRVANEQDKACSSCGRRLHHNQIIYSADWDRIIEAVRQGNEMAEMEDTAEMDQQEMAALKTLLVAHYGVFLFEEPEDLELTFGSRSEETDSMETAILASPPRVLIEEPIELGSSASEESSSMGSGWMERAARVERGDLRGDLYSRMSVTDDDDSTAAEGSPSMEVVSLASSSTARDEDTTSSVVILPSPLSSAASVSVSMVSPAAGTPPPRPIRGVEFQEQQLLSRYIKLYNRLAEPEAVEVDEE